MMFLSFFFLNGGLSLSLLIVFLMFLLSGKKYLVGMFFVKLVLFGFCKYGSFFGMMLLKSILLIVVSKILCFCFFVYGLLSLFVVMLMCEWSWM